MIAITSSIQIPEDEFTWAYARSGGPGGQNVNKVASKATMRWAMAASPSLSDTVKARLRADFPSHVTAEGEFLVTSQEYRDQARNRERCREKFVAMLLTAATPPKERRPTKPSKSSRKRRVAEKKRQSAKKATRRGGGWDE
jgi:ribosome-associated protein